MIWKIFFVIASIFVFLMTVIGLNSDYSKISSLEYFIDLLLEIGIAFILGILYSLGWKQQLFSKKSANIFLALFIISMVLIIIIPALEVYPDIYAQVPNSVVAILINVIIFSILAIIVNVFLIPFYVGLYKYKKNFDTLALVDKPYWKILSLYYGITSVGFVVYALTKYTHFPSYNFIDYYAIISGVYETIFMIGFAWNVRIFNKLFWQVTAIPYVVLMFMTPFFISDTFNQDFHFKEIIFGNPVSMILFVMLSGVFLFIIYKYAYKDKI